MTCLELNRLLVPRVSTFYLGVHNFTLNPDQMRALVAAIERLFTALGFPPTYIALAPSECNTRSWDPRMIPIKEATVEIIFTVEVNLRSQRLTKSRETVL